MPAPLPAVLPLPRRAKRLPGLPAPRVLRLPARHETPEATAALIVTYERLSITATGAEATALRIWIESLLRGGAR